jgi:hypothetical protein
MYIDAQCISILQISHCHTFYYLFKMHSRKFPSFVANDLIFHFDSYDHAFIRNLPCHCQNRPALCIHSVTLRSD